MDRRLLFWAVFGLGLGVGGWIATRPDPPPLILLVTIDTCRQDFLGHAGMPGAYTPTLDRLAREGAQFDRAYCQIPTTGPSHASILTGQYPATHGLRANVGPAYDLTKTIFLPSILQDWGYETAGFFGQNDIVNEYRLTEGLDVGDSFPDGEHEEEDRILPFERPMDVTLGLLLDHLDQSEAERRFLWLHAFDPHAPYAPPEEVRKLFPAPDVPYPPEHLDARKLSEPALIEGIRNPREYRRLYQGELAQVDRLLGDLMAALEERGLLEEALVIVTADHGESLGEDGIWFGHSRSLHESSVRIPLIFWGRGAEELAKLHTEPVESIDIAPTILELSGLPIPRTMEGESLLRKERRHAIAEVGATEISPHSKAQAVITADQKLLTAPDHQMYPWLPEGQVVRTLATATGAHPEDETSLLRDLLAAHALPTKPVGGAAQPTLSPEKEERLRALGYVSGPAVGPRKQRTTKAAVKGDMLLSPPDGAVLATPPEFAWEPIPYTETYRFYLHYKSISLPPSALDFPAEPPRIAEGFTAELWQNLPPGRYDWAVEALDEKGRTVTTSPVWHFWRTLQKPVNLTAMRPGDVVAFKAADFPGNVGEAVGAMRITGEEPGYALFGPEQPIAAGRYRVGLTYEAPDGTGSHFDVWQEGSIAAAWELSDGNRLSGSMRSIGGEVALSAAPFALRVWSAEGLTLSEVTIERL